MYVGSCNDASGLNALPLPSMSCRSDRPRPCLRPISPEERLQLNQICGTTQTTSETIRIAYGDTIPFTASPWTAALVGPNENDFCSLVVFSNKHALGALHCLWDEKTGKMIENALDFEVRYGGDCVAESKLCKEKIPPEYVYNIVSFYHPASFSTAGTRYDFFVLEVNRPFNFDGAGRPICVLGTGSDSIDQARQKFVENICDSDSLMQSGYSGITIEDPTKTYGLLHKINSKFSNPYQSKGDQILIESVQQSNQTHRPTTVGGDSGGPAYCLAKITPSTKKRTVLVGNLKRGVIESGHIIYGKDELTFTPLYWKLFCSQKDTNACFKDPNSLVNQEDYPAD